MKWMKLLLPALLAASVLFCPAAEVCAAEQAACSGSFTVTKRVKESALRQEEEPVYRFRLELLDENDSVKRMWTRTIYPRRDRLYPIDPDGYTVLKTDFTHLPEGKYRVVELGARQYDFSKCGSLSFNALADGNAVRFSIGEGELKSGSAAFVSRSPAGLKLDKFSL